MTKFDMKYDVEIGVAWPSGEWGTRFYNGVEARNEEHAFQRVKEIAEKDFENLAVVGVFLHTITEHEEEIESEYLVIKKEVNNIYFKVKGADSPDEAVEMVRDGRGNIAQDHIEHSHDLPTQEWEVQQKNGVTYSGRDLQLKPLPKKIDNV